MVIKNDQNYFFIYSQLALYVMNKKLTKRGCVLRNANLNQTYSL